MGVRNYAQVNHKIVARLTHTDIQSFTLVTNTCISLDDGRKPEYQDDNMGRTSRLHTERLCVGLAILLGYRSTNHSAALYTRHT